MKRVLGLAAAVACAAGASAPMRIIEWMYNGADGEFVEFTNVGGSAVEMKSRGR